jgi:hypothetical protein
MATAASCMADDLMRISISRQVGEGRVLAQGIATPLVAAGYLLAKLAHALDATLALAIGNTLCPEAASLGLTRTKELWGVKPYLFLASSNPLAGSSPPSFRVEIAPHICESPPPYRRGGSSPARAGRSHWASADWSARVAPISEGGCMRL